MALWSRGRSPDTEDSDAHAKAHAWAAKQLKKALKICKGCPHCRKVIPYRSTQEKIICAADPEQQVVSITLRERKCVKANALATKAGKAAKDKFYARFDK